MKKIKLPYSFCLGTLLIAISGAMQKYRVDQIDAKNNRIVEILNPILGEKEVINALNELDEFDGIASSNEKSLNLFTSKYSLAPVSVDEQDALYSIGYFKLNGAWKTPGKRKVQNIDGKNYHFAKMGIGENYVKEFGHKDFDIIFGIKLKGDYTVFLGAPGTKLRNQIVAKGIDFFGLIDTLQNINTKNITKEYYDIMFPFLTLDEEQELPFLNGVTLGTKDFVSDIIQNNKLQLDHNGIKIESETRLKMTKSKELRPYIFDEPFLLWLTHESIGLPLFTMWADKQFWSKV